MNFLKERFQLSKHKVIGEQALDDLYSFARKSLISLLLLETIFLYLLHPYVGDSVFIWYGIIVIFTLWRLHDAYDYKKSPKRYTLERWHKRFVVRAWLTALMYAVLILFITPQLSAYYQLLVFVIILGMSSAEANALSHDYRTAIGFLLMLYVPLFIEMMLITRMETFILAFLLLIYFFAQANIIMHAYRQKKSLDSKEEKISEIEALLHEKQMLLHGIFQEAPIGIFSCNVNGNIINCNEELSKLFECSEKDIIGKKPQNIFENSNTGDINRVFKGKPLIYNDTYLLPSGEQLLLELKYFPFTDSNNKSIGIIGIVNDKTKEHQTQEQLKLIASQDSLTSLLNRRGLEKYMHSIANDERHTTSYSLLYYLDLNEFKTINDSLGHSIGDIILIDISRRLSRSLEFSCEVCRLGGDEFVVIIPFVSPDHKIVKEKVHHYTQKILKAFEQPFIVKNIRLKMTTSIGTVAIEPNFKDIEEILRRADIAMYQSKYSGDIMSCYDPLLDEEQKEQFELQADFHKAIKNNQLKLLLQPIVQISDDSIIAAETLVRWQHPTKGLLNPDKFIPIALKSGLLWEMTWWIVEQTCIQIASWKKDNLWSLDYVSININAKQLLQDNFSTHFIELVKSYGLKCSDIVLELTEKTLIENFEITKKVIHSLQCSGVRCAIDDFGVGYSSLSYLQKLSFDTLKIDKSFVANIENNIGDIALIKTIFLIAKQFNYNLVVEGIENKKQKKILLELGDNITYQGFLFSKPISQDEFTIKYLSHTNLLEYTNIA